MARRLCLYMKERLALESFTVSNLSTMVVDFLVCALLGFVEAYLACFERIFVPVRAGVIFPSLLQLQRGITDLEDRKQKDLCRTRYRKKDELNKGKFSEVDVEREDECGICLEMNSKIVLPNCCHSLCSNCYKDW